MTMPPLPDPMSNYPSPGQSIYCAEDMWAYARSYGAQCIAKFMDDHYSAIGTATQGVDMVARGPKWDDADAMIRECAEQAGIGWGNPKPLLVNLLHRVATASHKAGFTLARDRLCAAPTAPPAEASAVAWLFGSDLPFLKSGSTATAYPMDRTPGIGSEVLFLYTRPAEALAEAQRIGQEIAADIAKCVEKGERMFDAPPAEATAKLLADPEIDWHLQDAFKQGVEYGKKIADTRPAAPPSEVTDAQRLDWLDTRRKSGASKGFKSDSWGYDTEKSVRSQIDAAIAATSAGEGAA